MPAKKSSKKANSLKLDPISSTNVPLVVVLLVVGLVLLYLLTSNTAVSYLSFPGK